MFTARIRLITSALLTLLSKFPLIVRPNINDATASSTDEFLLHSSHAGNSNPLGRSFLENIIIGGQ